MTTPNCRYQICSETLGLLDTAQSLRDAVSVARRWHDADPIIYDCMAHHRAAQEWRIVDNVPRAIACRV